MTESKRILRLPEVIKRTGIKRSTIYLKMQLDEFPQSISLGARSCGWLESDIDSWISSCIENSRREEV